jgi:hypothetical protein
MCYKKLSLELCFIGKQFDVEGCGSADCLRSADVGKWESWGISWPTREGRRTGKSGVLEDGRAVGLFHLDKARMASGSADFCKEAGMAGGSADFCKEAGMAGGSADFCKEAGMAGGSTDFCKEAGMAGGSAGFCKEAGMAGGSADFCEMKWDCVLCKEGSLVDQQTCVRTGSL